MTKTFSTLTGRNVTKNINPSKLEAVKPRASALTIVFNDDYPLSDPNTLSYEPDSYTDEHFKNITKYFAR